jgi:hypothetical protein
MRPRHYPLRVYCVGPPFVQDPVLQAPKRLTSDYARPVASDDQAPGPPPTFELKRFDWLTPDRLAVSGTFGGLGETPAEASPVLVLHEGESVHRLPAISDSLDGPPEDGQVWKAAFAWQDAPVAFDVAELELGDGLVVELPDPGAKNRLSRRRVLEIRTPPQPDATDERAASVGSQVDLLAAQEELHDVRVELEQTQAELTRARDDLRAGRERRAGDSERFRDGLAKVRESAEEALAAEQRATRQLEADLQEARDAIGTNDAELQTLREQLDAAESETLTLHERVTQLETAAEETERLRAELKEAGDAIDQARNDAERLLDRLTTDPAK